jgi:hypothetical protein
MRISNRDKEHNKKSLQEGDVNTKYLHLNACGRKKKIHITVLLNNGEEIPGMLI